MSLRIINGYLASVNRARVDFYRRIYGEMLEMHPYLTVRAKNDKTLLVSSSHLFAGVCNLRHIIFENLASIISGIKGKNEELAKRFQAEIEAIQNTVVSLVGGLLAELEGEMGVDAVNYQLDNHEVSHAFEHWLKEADLGKLDDPSQLIALKRHLLEHIGIKEGDSSRYIEIIEKHLRTGKMTELIAKVKDLKAKTEEYAKGEGKDKSGGSRADERARAARAKAGKAKGGAGNAA